MHNGQLKPLTHDKKQKGDPVLSPADTRIAYYEQCVESEHCTPTVVILDLDGNQLMGIQPRLEAVPPVQPCMDILSLRWFGENAVAVECHHNPSLNEYVEVELDTGRNFRDLLGYGFVRSPDLKRVAHVGWIIHFGPPYVQSEYVQFDRETVYPVRERGKPLPEMNGLPSPPDVVKLVKGRYVGIHEVRSRLVWSPDSKSVAFVDCTYSWTPNTPSALAEADGRESPRACALAIAGFSRKPESFALAGRNVEKTVPEILWHSNHRVTLRSGDLLRQVTVR